MTCLLRVINVNLIADTFPGICTGCLRQFGEKRVHYTLTNTFIQKKGERTLTTTISVVGSFRQKKRNDSLGMTATRKQCSIDVSRNCIRVLVAETELHVHHFSQRVRPSQDCIGERMAMKLNCAVEDLSNLDGIVRVKY